MDMFAAISSLFTLIYLFWALLRPEQF
ncbi:MAG: potassium-transporting ATPase subunit F [Proteobacteria bacterium]|nr:MAG: potassium-transporting ATPase subunit F [Pseudomonadota bacterium]